jgi:hypothetical protein
MAASIYKQSIPLANAMRKPGEWQVYDVIWTAPTFDGVGKVKTPAYVTALHNGGLVQNPLRAERRNALHRCAFVQSLRWCPDQAAGARRPEQANQLPQYLDPGALTRYSMA